MTGSDAPDRRKYARLDINSRVLVSILETDDKNPQSKIKAISKNIGAEGVCFNSEHPLDPGMILDLEIVLPDTDETVSIEGRVMWCTPASSSDSREQGYDTGVKFLDIDKNHIKLITEYVSKKLSGGGQ